MVCLFLNFNLVLLIFLYLGVECVIFNYNVMCLVKVLLEVSICVMVVDLGKESICVNVIFVGLICILVVFGIKDFKKMLFNFEKIVFLCCIVMIEDVGNLVVFLCLDLVGGIIGEVVYVDVGFSIVVMGDISVE